MSYLKQATAEAEKQTVSLRVIETRECAGKVLAVCERGSTLVLAVERERGLFADGATVAASDDDKRSRDHGVERYFKPTSSLADFAHAVESGLL